ncbi:hypothetical protein ACQ4PT_061653 [Festuca glaucescens]
MEGRSGAPRVAAADLVRNRGVVEPDVAVAGRGRRRGAAALGGLVAAADQEEHGFRGATVPDLDMVPAGDTLVGETSSVRKRKFDEVDESEDSSHSYISSDIESGDAVSYNSASSDASSEAEVTKYNELSYEKRVEEKIWEEGVSAYLNTAGKYYCKFHPFKKVPRDGMREGLVAHAKTVKPKDHRDKANHAALIKVNMDAHIAQVDAPRNAQKRITIRGPGIVGNADFDSFCVFSNLVEMDDEQLGRVKRVVHRANPRAATTAPDVALAILLVSSISKALIHATAAICKATLPDTTLSRDLLHARPNTTT